MSAKSSAKKPSIEEVKERHEMRLMGIEGVQGVGIGKSDSKGERVIKVYVDKQTKSVRGKIPKQLDGYPVMIETSGEFQSF